MTNTLNKSNTGNTSDVHSDSVNMTDDQKAKAIDEVLREAIEDNQFIDGMTEYMLPDALDGFKHQLLKLIADCEVAAVKKELDYGWHHQKHIESTGVSKWFVDRIKTLTEKNRG